MINPNENKNSNSDDNFSDEEKDTLKIPVESVFIRRESVLETSSGSEGEELLPQNGGFNKRPSVDSNDQKVSRKRKYSFKKIHIKHLILISSKIYQQMVNLNN